MGDKAGLKVLCETALLLHKLLGNARNIDNNNNMNIGLGAKNRLRKTELSQ